MGQIVTLETRVIKPSQTYLRPEYDCPPGRESSLAYHFRIYHEGKEDSLMPSAIRMDPYRGDYITIDGHHRIVMADLFGRKVKAYLVENSWDIINVDKFAKTEEHRKTLTWTNHLIKRRFETVLEFRKELEEEKLCSFSDLRGDYAYLVSLEKAKKYFLGKDGKDNKA
jgi:hypothetical protein